MWPFPTIFCSTTWILGVQKIGSELSIPQGWRIFNCWKRSWLISWILTWVPIFKRGLRCWISRQWFANADLDKQASAIATGLKTDNKIDVKSDKEIIALIAYLQRIGKDIKLEPKTAIQ